MDANALPFPAMRARVRRMAQAEDDPPIVVRRQRWPVVLAVVVGLIALAIVGGWLARERIAGTVIAGQLETYGLPARYKIESIGPRRQVLRDVVVGDPAHPDLTIERVETELVPTFGAPAISKVTLVRPRLYGSYRGGRLSFGALDKALFGAKRTEAFRLPNMDLTVVDGRGLVDSEFGPVGLRLDGKGPLRGGFAGTLAAIAPQVAAQGCRAELATLYGSVVIKAEKPRFAGPLRLGRMECAGSRLSLARVGLQVDATFDATLDGVEGRVGLKSDTLAMADSRILGSEGTIGFTWRKRALTARYELVGHEVATPQAAAVALTAAGVVRSSASRIEIEGELGGNDVQLGLGLDAALAQLQRSAADTLAAPLLGQVRSALLREGEGSRLTAQYILRRAGGATNLVVPQAALRGGSGATLLSLSHFQLTADRGAAPRLAGNFATGGPGMPQIAGRLERQPAGRLVTRMAMPEYRAGDARIALPRLTLVQLAGGALGFAGEARLSGALPGGQAENLVLPLEGNWSAGRGLAAWRGCTTLRFDRLALANVTFDRRSLSLCPPRGGAIVAADSRGLRIAAGAPAVDLAGRLGATPIRIRSGPVGLALKSHGPGTLAARSLDVELGPAATASHFRVANLGARVGQDIAGSFAGSDVRLAAVPLDIVDAGGAWRFAQGKLTLTGAAFRLEDRQQDDRFQPLVARDGTLELADNRITATATLREPASDREVVRTVILHDLGTGRGNADLAVAGILFDDRLQPDTLSRLALGVIANARGSLRGSGRIDWTPETVTSTGAFTTDGLDFAAVFGPVKGAAGTIHFTDLLGMVSAPDQQLRIASINPGIEVDDGVLTYELRPDAVLAVKGAAWPFLDGTLTLLPVTMRMGVAEARRYTLMIEGLNAARFVERMELANLAATGMFDGTLPLVFDENGGRIDGGQLSSRPPGGTVSYVGALTYKDLSPMANFAFDALKSLDYRDMQIAMNGPLEGEIVTRVQFAGIRQGAAAKRNFLTERIAKLPIRFNVNLRAPFFQLASSFRSLYDPAYVRDPRTLGLLDEKGRPVASPAPTLRNGASGIQPAESGKRR
ncbi:MAG: YdbH domain-containing protein [Sphingomonadales bacterium]|nr:YdbH domain-containing protein [Sphingomonadales bacterium]